MTTLAELVVKVTLDSSQFQREISGMNGKLRSIGDDMVKIGGSLTRGLTLPIVGAGIAAFKLHKDFEYSMQQIVGLVGVAQSQVDEWKDDLVRMGPELGKGPKELADALYFVMSAGIDASEALNVVEMSAKASAAGLGDTATIADLVTSAMNAYGSENLSAAQATDILVAAVREGKAEASELAGSLGKVLPISSELGIEFHEVAAATAAMTRTGTDANTAATQLRAIMSSLLRPTKQAEEVLNEMGTSSADLRKKIRDDGLLATLMELRDLTHEYGEEAMAQVFPNIRALIGMLDLMGANLEDNVKIFESLTDATGALDHAFEVASATSEFKLQQAIASLQSMMISIGDVVKEAVVPILEGLVETLGKVTDWFKRLSPQARTSMLRMIGFAAALGPVLLIGGKLIGMFVSLANGMILFGRGLRLVIGFIKAKAMAMAGLRAVMALMAGPAGWITLAVVAIAAIGVAWWKSTQDSGKAMEQLRTETEVKMMGLKHDLIQSAVETKEGLLEQYTGMRDEGIRIFESLATGQNEIGEAGFELLMETLEGQKEEKLAFLEQQKQEELAVVDDALRTGVIKHERQAAAMKQKIEEDYLARATVVEEGYIEINRIAQESLDEHGYITEVAAGEIAGIYEGMFEDIIDELENFIRDYAALEQLKNIDINDMTEAELIEYNRILEKGYEDATKKLEDHVGDSLAAAVRLYGPGGIQEDADKFNKAYEEIIKESIGLNVELSDSFGELKTDVADRLKEMAWDSVPAVEDMTVDIWTLFDWLKKQLVGNSIVPDMVKDIITWFKSLDSLPKTLRTIGGNIMSGLLDGLRSRWNSIRTFLSTVAQSIKSAFDPNQRRSPSLVDLVRKGAKDITEAYENIKLPQMKANDFVYSLALPSGVEDRIRNNQSGVADTQGGNKNSRQQIPELNGKLAMIIADERVLKQLYRQLNEVSLGEGWRTA